MKARLAHPIPWTLACLLAAASAARPATDRVDAPLLERLAERGRANAFVKMASDADLGAAFAIRERVLRRQFVYDTLTEHAERTQRGVTRILDERGIRYQPFWINNSVYVYEADLGLVLTLAGRADVAYVRADRDVPLARFAPDTTPPRAVDVPEWGIQKINADDVWATGNTGQGIVVANNDTGVRYTHEALVRQYRGNDGGGGFSHDYNWWDPKVGQAGSETQAPVDNIGHGTHTMGTMVGGDAGGPLPNDIGVAPGARWIAAKGCQSNACSDFDLASAAQFLACPTRLDGSAPNCSKAPDVINNSWGGAGGDPFYQAYVDAWVAAGIMPVFSAGSSGPACNTVGSPADYRNVIGVGGSSMDDVLMSFSSKGPGPFRRVKPDVVAPAEAIRSAYNTSDTSYVLLTGTSMSTAHVSGTIALMLHAHPAASLKDLYVALGSSAERMLGNPPDPDACGGRRYDVYPNAIYGRGRIDAAAAVARDVIEQGGAESRPPETPSRSPK